MSIFFISASSAIGKLTWFLVLVREQMLINMNLGTANSDLLSTFETGKRGIYTRHLSPANGLTLILYVPSPLPVTTLMFFSWRLRQQACSLLHWPPRLPLYLRIPKAVQVIIASIGGFHPNLRCDSKLSRQITIRWTRPCSEEWMSLQLWQLNSLVRFAAAMDNSSGPGFSSISQ